MLKRTKNMSFLAVLLFLTGITVIAKPKKPFQMPPVVVETVKIQLVTKADEITATGTLIASSGITIKSEIAGKITKIYFKSGDKVEKGMPLVEINSDSLKAGLTEAIADYKAKKLHFDRITSLHKTKAVSKSDLDKAQADYEAAKAKVAGRGADLEQAAITAPFSGKLGLSKVNEGEYVTPGHEIVNLQALDPLMVDFSVPEIYLSKVGVNQKVVLTTDAYPGEIFKGEVEATESLINQNNRTLDVRANVSNGDGKLIPGGFVYVTLQFSERQVFAVPQTSIVYESDGTYVYKVENNKAEKVKVVLGKRESVDVEIKSGLNVGDVVVTSGGIKIYPGATLIDATNKK
jgi:membrane fusion protein, multidrug efflux system